MTRLKLFIRSLFVALLFAAVPAQGAIIDDVIGELQLAPVEVDIDTVLDAVNVNGTLHLVGFNSNGTRVRQLIDLTTGVSSSVESFVGQNGGTSDVGISRVVDLDGGGAMYLGVSANGAFNASPTYWFDPNTANATGQVGSGFLLDSSADGTYVGGFNNVAAVGSLGNQLQPLPGIINGSAKDITSDASYIAGDSIWHLVNDSYQMVNTLGFEVPTNALSLPTTWESVAIDPVVGGAVFGGYFLDANTFINTFGFWRANGTFLFAADAGAEFSDFEVYDGQLVAALNGLDDGVLYAISDGSNTTVEQLTGAKNLFEGKGLYQGSVGLLLRGTNGVMTTTYETNGGTEVPEPSSLLLALSGLLFGGFKRANRMTG